MKYIEAKQYLYNSEEIANIPDRWQNSLPFICVIDNQIYDAIFYYTNTRTFDIHRMLLINVNDGSILTLDKNELQDKYDISQRDCFIKSPKDYDNHFKDLDSYETKYENIRALFLNNQSPTSTETYQYIDLIKKLLQMKCLI